VGSRGHIGHVHYYADVENQYRQMAEPAKIRMTKSDDDYAQDMFKMMESSNRWWEDWSEKMMGRKTRDEVIDELVEVSKEDE
jgi:hypothetical protein